MFPRKLTRQVICEPGQAEVETKAGWLRGVIVEGNYIFRGIKYANAKRFQLPELVEPWKGVKEAIIFGPVCPEISTRIAHDEYTVPHYHYCQDEDCLYLNIWTKTIEKAAKKPVMVWIHGGGFKTGSSIELYAYDGEEMAEFGDVVFVSVNHRINCVGYMDMSAYGEEFKYSGVAGIADLVEALHWIHDNIENFGGDPSNVTIMGQSGGGQKIRTIMQTPAADGLYHKAIIQSGINYVDPETTKEMALREAELTIQNLGLTPETAGKAVTVPYYKLAQAAQAASNVICQEYNLPRFRWQPTYGTDYYLGLPMYHGFRKETENIPMIVGTCFGESYTNFNKKVGDGMKNTWTEKQVLEMLDERYGHDAEAVLESFKRAYPEKAVADCLFIDSRGRHGTLQYAHKRAKECMAPVWNFMFNLEMPVSNGSTTWHNAEEAYVFHNAQYLEASYIPGVTENLQDIMAMAWATFAHTGNPNHPGMPLWHTVKDDGVSATMIFDRNVTMKYDHDKELMSHLPVSSTNGGNRRSMDVHGVGPRQSL